MGACRWHRALMLRTKPLARLRLSVSIPRAGHIMNERPQFLIEEEIGQRVVEAADQLSKFAPDLEASFPFELDDVEFILTVKRKPQ